MKYLSLGGFEYLFDVVADPLERANLRGVRPDDFARLKARFDDWNAAMLPYPESTFSYDFKAKGTIADRY